MLAFLIFDQPAHAKLAVGSTEVINCAAILSRAQERGPLSRVEITPRGVSFKGQIYPKIVAEPVPEADTMRFRSAEGRIPKGSQAIITLFHGIGADISHSGTMLIALNMFLQERTQRSTGTTAKIHNTYPYIKFAAQSMDLPENGYGGQGEDLSTTIEILANEFRGLKELAPELPLIVFGRSASTGILVAVNHKYPSLIDGMILMSPMTPEPNAYKASVKGYEEDWATIARQVAEGKKPAFSPNPPAADWMGRVYGEMNWHLNPKRAFGNLPVLVLVGSKDAQTPPEVRELFKKYVQYSPDGHYVEIEGAGHDVISIMPQDIPRGVRAFGAIYNFTNEILKRQAK